MNKRSTIPFDWNHTLEELEEEVWGEPDYDSHLVTTCYALRKKPLRDFTTEDLRIMVGQNQSLLYLLPLALGVLEDNPIADGDFYEGDLLVATLRCVLTDHPHWHEYASRLGHIADRALESMDRPEHATIEEIQSQIRKGRDRMKELRNQKG